MCRKDECITPHLPARLELSTEKVADGLLGGKAIRIEGGDFELATEGGTTMTTGRQVGRL